MSPTAVTTLALSIPHQTVNSTTHNTVITVRASTQVAVLLWAGQASVSAQSIVGGASVLGVVASRLDSSGYSCSASDLPQGSSSGGSSGSIIGSVRTIGHLRRSSSALIWNHVILAALLTVTVLLLYAADVAPILRFLDLRDRYLAVLIVSLSGMVTDAVSSAVALSDSRSASSDGVVGLCALAVDGSLMLLALYSVTSGFRGVALPRVYVDGNAFVVRVVLGPRSASGYAEEDEGATLRLWGRPLFEDYRFDAHWYFAMELVVLLVESVANGLLNAADAVTVSESACNGLKTCVVAVYAAYVLSLILTRPYRFRHHNVAFAVLALSMFLVRQLNLLPIGNARTTPELALTTVGNVISCVLFVVDEVLLRLLTWWDAAGLSTLDAEDGSYSQHNSALLQLLLEGGADVAREEEEEEENEAVTSEE